MVWNDPTGNLLGSRGLPARQCLSWRQTGGKNSFNEGKVGLHFTKCHRGEQASIYLLDCKQIEDFNRLNDLSSKGDSVSSCNLTLLSQSF